MTDIQLAEKFVQFHSDAKTNHAAFSMTLVKLRRLLTKKKCEVTGIEFNPNGAPDIKERKIIRIDPTKNFTDDNMMACTVLGSRVLLHMSPAMLRAAAKNVKKLTEVSFNG